MTQKVLQVGSSAGVIIPKKTLGQLGLHIGDEVMVEVNKRLRAVFIRPQKGVSKHGQRIAELTIRFIDRYRKDLEKLAKM